MSYENITAPTGSDYILNPQLSYLGNITRIKSKGSCLKQDKITCTHGKIENIYIVHEISKKYNISGYPTSENCLSGVVNLTKMLILTSINILDMELDLLDMSFFTDPSGGTGGNVIIFGIDLSSSTKIDNRKKHILIIGKGPAKRLEHRLSAEKLYLINFTEDDKIFCLILYYNGENRHLFVNGTDLDKFSGKDSEIVATIIMSRKDFERLGSR